MGDYVPFTLNELLATLNARATDRARWGVAGVDKGEVVVQFSSPLLRKIGVAIRVGTTIQEETGRTRRVGGDSIKVYLVHMVDGKWRGVGKASARVFRTAGAMQRIMQHSRDLYEMAVLAERAGVHCLECGGPLIRRTKEGQYDFFGCMAYPDCRGSVEVGAVLRG